MERGGKHKRGGKWDGSLRGAVGRKEKHNGEDWLNQISRFWGEVYVIQHWNHKRSREINRVP